MLAKYIDFRQATANMLRDYRAMASIIRTTDEKIKSLAVGFYSSPSGGDGIRAKNPHSLEARIASHLDDEALLIRRYNDAVDYMRIFKPAWGLLSDEDRRLLSMYYFDQVPIMRIQEVLCVERSAAYGKLKRALSSLAVGLFGQV